jgi:hypothetical protein
MMDARPTRESTPVGFAEKWFRTDFHIYEYAVSQALEW